MFKVIDWVILVVLVSLAILIGFIAKFQKWRVKWHERCEKKRKLARGIDFDPEFALDVTETTLMGGAAVPRAFNNSPSSTLMSGRGSGGIGIGSGNGRKHASISRSSVAGLATATIPTPPATNRPSFLMNAISLVIGFQTSTSIVGLPLEFYYYGAHSYQFALCMFIAPILIALFFVPFLYKIKAASIYDYLNDKFGNGSKQVCFTHIISDKIVYLTIFWNHKPARKISRAVIRTLKLFSEIMLIFPLKTPVFKKFDYRFIEN